MDEWRREIRAFLADYVTDDVARELRSGGEWGGGAIREFRAELYRRRWLTLSLAEEDGGAGRSMVEQVVLMDELAYAGAPSVDMTASSVAPTIIRSATDEQRSTWLPRIASGEVEFAIGYSEPASGSDLASLRCSAVRDGDEWVVNGHKLWNTGAEYCTHEWLACRTDVDAETHAGISLLIVPLDASGIEVRPIITWQGMRTNEVWFTDVRVPLDHLVGEVGSGWNHIGQALDFERIAIGITGGLERLFDEMVEFIGTLEIDGRAVADEAWVRSGLAEMEVDLTLARLLNHHAAAVVDAGGSLGVLASMTKLATTELHSRAARLSMDLLGRFGAGEPDDAIPLVGLVQRMYRTAPYLRFGGGTNEIQRDIIARGLGMRNR